MLDELFLSHKLRAAASFQNIYVGLTPYQGVHSFFGGVFQKTAASIFGLLSALEIHPDGEFSGVYAPIGGFRAVGNGLKKLAEDNGVRIQCGATVTKIDDKGVYYKDNKGNPRFLEASVVIVNPDLPFAKKSLLRPRGADHSDDFYTERYDWEDKYDLTSAFVVFHWSLKKTFDVLNTHSMFVAAKSRAAAVASWDPYTVNEVVGSGSRDHRDVVFYVHRATASDPSAAPKGCDAITVAVPCEDFVRNPDWSDLPRAEALERYGKELSSPEFVAGLRRKVLDRMAKVEGLEELEGSIIDEVVDTPLSFASNYNLGSGVPFGLSMGFGQLGPFRPSHESSEFENLLFVGASTRPGHGVSMVLLGAEKVAETALEKLSRLKKEQVSPKALRQVPIASGE